MSVQTDCFKRNLGSSIFIATLVACASTLPHDSPTTATTRAEMWVQFPLVGNKVKVQKSLHVKSAGQIELVKQNGDRVDSGKIRLKLLEKTSISAADSKNDKITSNWAPAEIESLSLKPGHYIIAFESSLTADTHVMLKFTPADPEENSGINRDITGATVLNASAPVTGTVNYRDANRTDWYQWEVPRKGFVTLSCETINQQSTTEMTFIDETGTSKKCLSKTLLTYDKPGKLFVGFAALETSSFLDYRIQVTFSPMPESPMGGIILKTTPESITIDMGTDDGIHLGTRGVIVRGLNDFVEFEIKSVLKRTSKAKVTGKINETDLNKPVTFMETVRSNSILKNSLVDSK